MKDVILYREDATSTPVMVWCGYDQELLSTSSGAVALLKSLL